MIGCCGRCAGNSVSMGRSRSMRMLALHGMGAVDLSQYNLAQQLLQQANSALTASEADYSANAANYGADIGSMLVNARENYTSILQAYIYAYGLATGQQPNVTGLEGMRRRRSMRGMGQALTVVAVGAGIAVIIAALYALIDYINGINTQKQAELQTAQNVGVAENSYQAAIQSGDPNQIAAAQQMLDVANTEVITGSTPSGSSLSSWFTQNWMWVALGLGGVWAVMHLEDL